MSITTHRRSGRTVLSAALVLAGAGLYAATGPASATETGPGVAAGHHVTVFANIDMVVATGYTEGQSMTVRVFRAGQLIGTATGPARSGDEGAGLEVNHGVDGDALPGDCWEGSAPDLRPGDRVVVTQGTITDEVTVDELDLVNATASGDTVMVHGVAKRFDGAAIAPTLLDTDVTFRSRVSGDLRVSADRIVAGATAGTVTMLFEPPYDVNRKPAGMTDAQVKTRLLTDDGHTLGFGHTEPPPGDAQMVEGYDNPAGHADGCGGVVPPEEPEEPEQPGGDVTSPTWPANAVTGSVSGSTASLTWSAAADNVGVASYRVYEGNTARSGVLASTTHSAQVTGLSAGVHTLTVRAVDAAGNSATSNGVTLTVAASPKPTDTTAPTVTRTSPANAATGVRRSGNVDITFSEAVQGVSRSTFKLVTSTGQPVRASVRRVSGATWRLNPSRKLSRNTEYRWELTGSATGIRDAAGNRLASTSGTFKTGSR